MPSSVKPALGTHADNQLTQVLLQHKRKKEYDGIFSTQLADYVYARIEDLYYSSKDKIAEHDTENATPSKNAATPGQAAKRLFEETFSEFYIQLEENAALVKEEIDAVRRRFMAPGSRTNHMISHHHLDSMFRAWWQSHILTLSTHNMDGVMGDVELDLAPPSVSMFLYELWHNVCRHFRDDITGLLDTRFDNKTRVLETLQMIVLKTLKQLVNGEFGGVLDAINHARQRSSASTPLGRDRSAPSKQLERIVADRLDNSAVVLRRSSASSAHDAAVNRTGMHNARTPDVRDFELMKASPSVVQKLYKLDADTVVSSYNKSLFD